MKRAIIMIGALVLTVAAKAHDAPSGWTYPKNCCDDGHCIVVDCAEISEQENFYAYRDHHFHKMVVKPSPDGECHACFDPRRVDGYCLYVVKGMV